MVEALVALVVISIGMLGIAALYLASLEGSRTAALRSQAVSLASDIADRIRANRAGAGDYNSADYGGAPAAQGCRAAECTAEELAEDDLNRWFAAINAALPGNPTGEVAFTPGAAGTPNTYVIRVAWSEAGSDERKIYQLGVRL